MLEGQVYLQPPHICPWAPLPARLRTPIGDWVRLRLGGLRVAWEWPLLASCLPEEPLILVGFFGFRFLVWILSFFIASGLGTCQGQQK